MANILMVAGLQFQVVLGLLGLGKTIDYEHTLWLMNISDLACKLQPLAVTFAQVKKGCPVCDKSCLQELLKENLPNEDHPADMSMFDPARIGKDASGILARLEGADHKEVL